MKVEILYFEGCPAYREAEATLREALYEEGLDAGIELIAVETEKKARELRFPGSPTIRIEGRDLFPVEERGDWRLGCRVYPTPDGLKGSPTAGAIKEALKSKGGLDAG